MIKRLFQECVCVQGEREREIFLYMVGSYQIYNLLYIIHTHIYLYIDYIYMCVHTYIYNYTYNLYMNMYIHIYTPCQILVECNLVIFNYSYKVYVSVLEGKCFIYGGYMCVCVYTPTYIIMPRSIHIIYLHIFSCLYLYI